MRGRISLSKGFSPLLFSSLITLCLVGCIQDNSILDNSQNRQLGFSVLTHGWNDSNSNFSDSKSDSRATPITGNTFDTSKNFNVIADVNKGGNWSTEVNNETVSYSTENKIWQTTATHYWPGLGNTVNFYAYYPTNISGSITHTKGSAPVLFYTVPDNATDQIDILASSKTGVAGNSYNQTPVDFKHIFAAVQFSVGSNGLGSGTISSISIGDVHNSGTYTFGSGWTLGTTTKTFTISLPKTISGTSGEDIYSGTYTLMMIPQMINNSTVTITYSNGGTLTKVISGTWEAGQTYNYGLSFIREYNYTGNVQSFIAPVTGTYKLEVWGAQGGGPSSSSINGGKGAYVTGCISLAKGSVLYLYVGQQPSAGTGGWNGGGSNLTAPYGGGGATDISLSNGSWNDDTHLYSRIIVAGGGGGYGSVASTNVYQGGVGGAWNGGNGEGDDPGYGATINEAGANASGSCNTNMVNAGFGYGGSNSWYDEGLGAGGGGWYGGGSAGGLDNNGSGGGGSSYVWTSSLATYYPPSSYKPSTSYYLSDVSSQAGVRSGDGYARITFVSAN
jgi:hypothetical protein